MVIVRRELASSLFPFHLHETVVWWYRLEWESPYDGRGHRLDVQIFTSIYEDREGEKHYGSAVLPV